VPIKGCSIMRERLYVLKAATKPEKMTTNNHLHPVIYFLFAFKIFLENPFQTK
jgi:hypothetical protein